MARRRPDGSIVVWDGTPRYHGGLLLLAPEVRQAAPAQPDDARDLPAVARRGRPARAGERATARVELRLTLGELRALQRLAAANGERLADMIRTTMLDLAADGAAPEAVVLVADLLNCCR